MKRISISESKLTQRRSGNGTEKDPSGTEASAPKRVTFEPTPAKNPSSSEIQKHTYRSENDFMRFASDELQFEIERARLDIFNRFENMKRRVDNGDKLVEKEMEIWIRGGLANIRGEKTPKNEFLIKSLFRGFEESIGNTGHESIREVNNTADDIRKILLKLIKRIEQSFNPRPQMDAVKVTRKDIGTYLGIGLWSLVAVLICVFPDYPLKMF